MDHDTPTINNHLASGPGQPPARPRARPLPPGRPPVTHVTPFPHPIDPNVRRACMKAAGRYRPEARRPPPVPGPCQPTGWAGEGTVSRECTAGDPGATDVPAPGEQVSVCTCGMAVYGVEIVGSIRRRFFSTSSSWKRTCACVCVGGGRMLDWHSPLTTRVVCTSDRTWCADADDLWLRRRRRLTIQFYCCLDFPYTPEPQADGYWKAIPCSMAAFVCGRPR